MIGRRGDFFQDSTQDLNKMIKKLEKVHLVRLQTYQEIKQQQLFQQNIFLEMGWSKQVETPEDVHQDFRIAHCGICDKTFGTEASLAVHQQEKHNMRIAMRRFAIDGVCRACGKQFHTRVRLLAHLHRGEGSCWIYHIRCFEPIADTLMEQLDQKDRRDGTAFHQRGHIQNDIDKAWRWATDEEISSTLLQRKQESEPWRKPDDEEPKQWATYGMLPPGRGGRERTERAGKLWTLPNVCHDISKMEERIHQEIASWTPNFDWVPRPLSEGRLFFLVLCSGHRRWGDISSWYHWDGRITPIAVDLAVCPEHGNIFHSHVWERLIQERRVVGAHGGPPCETYSVARWRDIPGQLCPQPLRDQSHPWGRLFLSLAEVIQCHVGTTLMMVTLRLLLLVYAFGGSISLEHPRGDIDSQEKWCIWLHQMGRTGRGSDHGHIPTRASWAMCAQADDHADWKNGSFCE